MITTTEVFNLRVELGKEICKRGYSLDEAARVLDLSPFGRSYRTLQDWYETEWIANLDRTHKRTRALWS